MKKIEKELKSYYLKSFEHDSQLEQIKRRTSFFDQKEERKSNPFFFKRFAPILCATCLIGVVAVSAVALSMNNPSSSNRVISPISNRLKKSIVKIESNPSISFTLDEEGIVTSIYGENHDGMLILYGEDLLNKPYEDVIKEIIDKEIECGYLLTNNNKYNNLKLKVYGDTDASLEELEDSIDDYLADSNVSLNEELTIEEEVNYEELLSEIYSYEEYQCDTFEEYYQVLENYYILEGTTASKAIEEFNQISYYYLDKLAYFKTIVDTCNDAILYNNFIALENRINNYLSGYYNNFVNETSSYQVSFNKLLQQKTDLIKNRIDENFDYEAQIKLISDSINALVEFKSFMLNYGLKDRLDHLNEELNKIKTYLENIDISSFDEEIYDKNKEDLKEEYNQKFNKDKPSKAIENMKKELIEFFK